MMAYILGMRSALVGLFLVIGYLVGCSSAVRLPTVAELIPGVREPLPPIVVLHGDTDYTPTERGQLEDAAKLWSTQTSGLANIAIVWDVDFTSTANIREHVKSGHNIMLRLESWMELVQVQDVEAGAALLGIVAPAGGIHNPWREPLTVGFVADRVGADYPKRATLAQIALHEFGHVLGVPHQDAMNAIMYPAAIKAEPVCLRKPDMSAFCHVNECGTYRMYPCE